MTSYAARMWLDSASESSARLKAPYHTVTITKSGLARIMAAISA